MDARPDALNRPAAGAPGAARRESACGTVLDGRGLDGRVLGGAGGRLVVRPAVAFREAAIRGETVFYLSLYGDEIEDRAAAFFDALRRRPPEGACADLELTDAAIGFGGDGAAWLARGGAATFPLYWRERVGALALTTALPVDAARSGGEALSRAGLAAAAAAACVHSSYEPNGFDETPLAGWRRARRGGFMRFRDGAPVAGHVILHADDEGGTPTRARVAEKVRAAFDAYGRSQARVARSLVEVSGGFDSTLAAAAAPRHEMHGVSVAFPYYEFRFEAAVQRAVADMLRIPRIELDGTDLFPYSAPDAPPRFDEPSVFATGMRHAEAVARHAAALGATRIYMGHGGDQCFSTDLTAREATVANPPSRGPFDRRAWGAVRRAMQAVRCSPCMDRRAGTFVYDARQDVWARETYGPVIRTPFADLAVFKSALAWSRHCAAAGARPDKSILAEALGDLLPPAVTGRKGKVAYDGVWMRAYRAQEERLCAVFERAAPVLEHAGVSPGWLIARARALAAWRACSDRETLALYAVCAWLQAWGIERPSDVPWAD